MFFKNTSFNQNIGYWDTSKVTMNSMRTGLILQPKSFRWCVSNITSQPQRFSQNSPLSTPNKPVWGTCPTAATAPSGAGTTSNPYLINKYGELRLDHRRHQQMGPCLQTNR